MKTSIMAIVCAAFAAGVSSFQALAEEEVVAPDRVVDLGEENEADVTADSAGAGGETAREVFSADNISEKAETSAQPVPESDNSAGDDLFQKGMVIPPTSDKAKTLEAAVRNVLLQADKQPGTVSSNGIDRLSAYEYKPLGDGKSQIEWRHALRHLLYPAGYSFLEDGDFVLFGLPDEVDARYHELAQEKLAMNRTPISFTSGENGMDLKNAIDNISGQAGFTYTVDYMDKSDLYVSAASAATKKALSADEIGIKGCETYEKLVEYVNDTFGLLGTVTEVHWA